MNDRWYWRHSDACEAAAVLLMILLVLLLAVAT